MKKIPEPDLKDCAVLLKPAEMNRIHFGGNHSPLTPEQMEALARGETTAPQVRESAALKK